MARKHSSKHYKISTGSNCLCNISRACAATILWNIGEIKINQALNILKVFPIPVSRNLLTLCMFFGEFWNCLPTTFELHQSYIYYYTAAKTKSIKDNKICDVRESNPGQLLGRQLCSPLYQHRIDGYDAQMFVSNAASCKRSTYHLYSGFIYHKITNLLKAHARNDNK